MRHLLCPAVCVLTVVLSSSAIADEPLPPPKPDKPSVLPPLPSELPPPSAELPLPCAGGCQSEKTICLPHLLLVEEQTAITVPKLTLRDQIIGYDVQHKLELTWKEEKHCVTEMKAVPHTVEQQVCTTKMVPQTSVDPVSGHACTIYVKVPEVRTVKVTVYDVMPVQREVIVRMPCIKPVDQPVEIHNLVVDETDEAAILKSLEPDRDAERHPRYAAGMSAAVPAVTTVCRRVRLRTAFSRGSA